MRFFDLGRLYTDWDEVLRERECLLSDSMDAIIYDVEHNIMHLPFSVIDSDEKQVVMAKPLQNGYINRDVFPFYAVNDVNGFSHGYSYCYLLPEADDE